LCVPAGQARHGVAFTGETVIDTKPTSHGVQTVPRIATHPAGQQAPQPVPLLPDAHAGHDADAVAEEKLPAGHGEHSAWPPTLYVPIAHGVL